MGKAQEPTPEEMQEWAGRLGIDVFCDEVDEDDNDSESDTPDILKQFGDLQDTTRNHLIGILTQRNLIERLGKIEGISDTVLRICVAIVNYDAMRGATFDPRRGGSPMPVTPSKSTGHAYSDAHDAGVDRNRNLR